MVRERSRAQLTLSDFYDSRDERRAFGLHVPILRKHDPGVDFACNWLVREHGQG